LPNADEHVACLVSDRMRAAIRSTPLTTESGITLNVTASFGCAMLSADHPYASCAALLAEADRCLYAAKKAGRDRIVTSEHLLQENSQNAAK